MFGCDEEVFEVDRVVGDMDIIIITSLRYIDPTHFSVIRFVGSGVPDIGKVVETVGQGLQIGKTIGPKLLVVLEVVGKLTDVYGAGQLVLIFQVLHQIVCWGNTSEARVIDPAKFRHNDQGIKIDSRADSGNRKYGGK